MAKILVVDDDLLISRAYYDILTDCGYDVAVCNNGSEAVEYCRVKPPDLVIMDIHMPVMNGLVACEKIREMPHCQNLPIIVISGSLGHSGKADSISRGADEFMGKPINTNELIDNINRLLGHSSRP